MVSVVFSIFDFTSRWINLVVFSTVSLTIVIYFYCSWIYRKWEKLKIPYVRPVPFFGNYLRVAMGAENLAEMYKTVYYQLAGHKYGGMFQMLTPYLMIRDPEIINTILVKDFSYFPNRGVYSNFSVNPLSNNLFWMETPQWKTIRSKLSPAFTSGKLKQMYLQIEECGREMMKNIYKEKEKSKSSEIDIREVLGKYSTDVIGTCFFGLKLNTVTEENSELRNYSKTLFKPSLRFLFREICIMISPNITNVIRLTDFPEKANKFFRSMFHQTIEYREKNNIIRNDFIHSLTQARKDLVLNNNLSENDKFTDMQIVANAFIMFAAGFETISTSVSYCLQELALKKHIQDKVREEIKLKKSVNNGVIDNDFLSSLNYLDMVIAETLRKYPVTFALFRKAARTYHVPNESLVIEKDQKIIIPINSLHYDPRYFVDPEFFDPERFSPENKVKIPNGVYLPFGDGLRICIGKRFAEMEMKLAIVDILSEFEVEPCEKTEIPIKFTCMTMVTCPKSDKIWLKLNPLYK